MSNIRPIGDPAIATAMLATMQSIDSVRSAPAGISEPRWRILQCIAKAAPNVPSSGELRMCSGLNKAALAEHVQALQWKGLLEMGGYRLSPSAAAMVGLEQPYPPKEAKLITLAGASPEAVEKLRRAIEAIGAEDMPNIAPAPLIIGVDLESSPDIVAAELDAFGADGKIAKHTAPVVPLDPADVPACMRPDCTPPVRPLEEAHHELLARKSGNRSKADRPCEGRSHPRGRSGRAEAENVAPRRIHRPAEVSRVARSGRTPAAQAEAARPEHERLTPAPQRQVSSPPAEPPKFTNWIEERARRLACAIGFLKSQAILVSVVDRDAQVRQYFVSGKRDRKFAEEVIEIAIEKGWVE